MKEEIKHKFKEIKEDFFDRVKHSKEYKNMANNEHNAEQIKQIWHRIVKIEKDLYRKENPSSGAEVVMYEELLTKNRKLKEKFAALEDNYNDSYRELKNSYEESFGKLEKKYVTLCEGLRQQSDAKDQEITRLNEENQKLEKKNVKLDQEISRLTQEMRDLEREKDDQEELYTNLQNKFSDTEKELEQAHSELRDKELELEQVSSKLRDKGLELEKALSELRNIDLELEKAHSELKDKGAELETAYSNLDREEKELEKANLKITQQQEEIARANSLFEQTRKELSDEKEQLNAELSSVRDILQQKEGELDSTRSILNKTEETLSSKERELTNTQGELSSTQQQLGNYSKQFGNWGDVTQDYRNILFKMYSCPSLMEIVSKFSLERDIENADTVDNVLKFIGVVGAGNSFALEVYNVMRAYKREHQDYLNEDELKFIDELNRYYRKVLQVEFDVLDVPATEKFENAAMQDMNKTTGVFRFMSGVYVPGLRGDEKTFKQKAIVQGAKN